LKRINSSGLSPTSENAADAAASVNGQAVLQALRAWKSFMNWMSASTPSGGMAL
jgi:hypothetical protein